MSPRPLGQHFLTDRTAISKIIAAADIKEDDLILEIGPGRGAITTELAKRARLVKAVELDSFLAENLPQLPNLQVIQGDFLKQNLPEILGTCLPDSTQMQNGTKRWKVVANLPYYITTPIIEKLLLEGTPYIETLIIMIQKEVADRIQSLACRESGALSYFVGYYAQAKTLFKVKPGCFSPPPKVDSSVMALHIYPEPIVRASSRDYLRVTRTAFGMRRKTLRRSLSALAVQQGVDIEQVLQKAGINPSSRPEELTIAQFSDLAEALYPVPDERK